MEIPGPSPSRIKSNQVGRLPPGLVDLPGQAGTPNSQPWYQVRQAGAPNPQPWHQVGLVSTPISRPWNHIGQATAPLPLGFQVGISPLQPLVCLFVCVAALPLRSKQGALKVKDTCPLQVVELGNPDRTAATQVCSCALVCRGFSPNQISQGTRPLGYQVASTPQPRDQIGHRPWDQICQTSTPLPRPVDKVAQVGTPPRPVGEQLGKVSAQRRWFEDEVGRIGTQYPVIGDTQGKVGTPLRRLGDELSRSSTEPRQLGYLLIGTPPRRVGDEAGRIGTQPPRLGDQLGYICVTSDDSRIVGNAFVHLPLNPDYTLSTKTLKEVFPDATGLYYYSADNLLMGVLQDEDKLFPPCSGDEVLYITRKMMDPSGGNHFRIKEESPLAPKGCCTCSELKIQVDEMTAAIQGLRMEISELKHSHVSTRYGSELDENANVFKPALNLSDMEDIKNYEIKRPGNKNKMHEEMEKCMEAKSTKITDENEDIKFFDDIVHTPDIQEIDKCVDMKLFALSDEEIAVQEMEKCVKIKTEKLIYDNSKIETTEKCVKLNKDELINENESIEEIDKCMEMKNAELIDLVSDKSPSVADEKSRKHCFNTRTASWVLNLPNVSDETGSETPSKISSIITSKAKLIHGNFTDKSVHSNNVDYNEKPESFQLEESSEDKNLLSSNTSKQLKTKESSPCDKSKNLLTLRPKLCPKKTDKKSSNQSVISKISEKGGIYDSDQSVKNHQPGSNENSPPMQASNQAPMSAKVDTINSQSRIKKDSFTASSKQPDIVTFHVQRGSSLELTEKAVHDFFSNNYGKVNSVIKGASSGKWIVRFASKIRKDVFYREIEINDCTVYTSRRLQDLTEETVKTQILLESRHLSMGWDRSIILRKHFEKFGKVLGVVFIGNKGDVKRAIVGFEDEKVAERLVGVTEVINGARVMIQRVNSKTV